MAEMELQLEGEISALDAAGWRARYQEIEDASKQLPYNSIEAERSEFFSKNRYIDVIPSDDYRVKLPTSDAAGQGGSDYINASWCTIDFQKPENNGSKQLQLRYILAQAPMAQTIADFWTMVWHEKCSTIIMLTDFIENRVNKCARYFPEQIAEGSNRKLFSSQNFYFDITLKQVEERNGFTERVLSMGIYAFRDRKRQLLETREITHYHFANWPDFQTPYSVTSFANFYLHLKGKNVFPSAEVGSSQPTTSPVIHCSAGIGRTGVLCLVDICHTMIFEGCAVTLEKLNGIVCKMREQRKGCVQTVEQFRFAVEAIVAISRIRRPQLEIVTITLGEVANAVPPLESGNDVWIQTPSSEEQQNGVRETVVIRNREFPQQGGAGNGEPQTVIMTVRSGLSQQTARRTLENNSAGVHPNLEEEVD